MLDDSDLPEELHDLPEELQKALASLVVAVSGLFDDSFSEKDKSDLWDLLKKESLGSDNLNQTYGDDAVRDMLADLVPYCKEGRKARFIGRFYYTKEEEGAKPIVGPCIPFVSCCAGCAIWRMHKKISPIALASCPSDKYISGIYLRETELICEGGEK
tara:strand:- start:7 stop:480 length:474 start_codon:yes stop_codon:yes gene_type:complete